MQSRSIFTALASLLIIALVVACAPAPAEVTPTPAKAPAATPPAKAPAATPAAAGPGDPAKGKTVFEANCNSCHPGGKQGVGPDIRGKDPDTVRRQVRNGGQAMPAFPPSQISDQQLNDLAAYVKSLQ